MRIATFNLLHGRSLEDGQVDLDRLAAAVGALDADVLGLQEVDRGQERSHRADLAAVAAHAMGAVDHRFVPAFAEPAGGDSGIALLTRYPVVSWQVLRLPRAPVRVPLWIPDLGRVVAVRDEPRVALAAVLDAPSGRYTVCTTHLSFVPGMNRWQLRRLVRSLADLPGPLILTGDLNLGPRAAARITGLRPLATAATFPAARPRRQLDHLLAGSGVRGVGPADALQMSVSDHRALVVACDLG